MSDSDPFLEHPTGEHASALDAMAAAIQRLDAQERSAWITVCAQDMGGEADSYQMVEVRLRDRTIDLNEHAGDESLTLNQVGPENRTSSIQRSGSMVAFVDATPAQLAMFLDVMFRTQLGIRGGPDQDNDYSVGFEW